MSDSLPPGTSVTPASDLPAPTPSGRGLSIAALVCGALGLVLCLPSIPALVLGIIALAKGRPGKGMAIAGIVLGGLGVLFMPILAGMLLPAITMVRTLAAEKEAVAVLHQVAAAERAFRDDALADRDQDRVGEYGFLDELLRAQQAGHELHLDPLLIVGTRHGWKVAVFLPGRDAQEGLSVDGPRDTAAIDRQELQFVAYAWPLSGRGTVLAVTESGRIYRRPGMRSSGTPAWNDLFGGQGWDTPPRWPLARGEEPGTRDSDGF